MEEKVPNEELKETPKKKNNSMYLFVAALLFILVGVGLIATGNNKSFLSDEKKESEKDEDDVNKGNKPVELTEEDIEKILKDQKEKDFSTETWSVGVTNIVAKGDNNSYLVLFEEISDDGIVTVKQTVITMENGEAKAELPGWLEGEKDLTSYNFVNLDEPTDTPEPTNPTEPSDPTDTQEPTNPTEPSDQTEQTNPVE